MSDAINSTPAPVESAAPAENTEVNTESTENTGTEGAVEGQDLAQKAAAGQPLTKVEAKKLKKLRIKFDQKEYDEDLPFEIPDTPEATEYMKKHLQMSKLSQTRAQEKSLIEKEVMQFIQDLQKNPAKVLRDPRLSVDLKKLAQEVIEEEIENSKKSPDQLRAEKVEAELKAMKEEREKEKEEAQQRDLERLKEQEYERYDMLMSQALDKAELPKSPYYVKKIADYMLMGIEAGMDVSPEDVLPLVQEEAFEDFRQLLAVLPVDKAEKLIGKDIINTIRKRNVSKAKQAAINPAVKGAIKTPDTAKKAAQTVEPAKKIGFKDFFKI